MTVAALEVESARVRAAEEARREALARAERWAQKAGWWQAEAEQLRRERDAERAKVAELERLRTEDCQDLARAESRVEDLERQLARG